MPSRCGIAQNTSHDSPEAIAPLSPVVRVVLADVGGWPLHVGEVPANVGDMQSHVGDWPLHVGDWPLHVGLVNTAV